MKTAPLTLALLPCLLAVAGAAAAQSDPAPCPHLDAASGLAWEHRAGPGYDFCRALSADGTQVLGVTLAAEAPFEPERSAAAERGRMGGREITWYASELAGDPDAQVRETLVELPDGRVAHVWLRADNRDALAGRLQLAEGLSFEPVLLSGAGP